MTDIQSYRQYAADCVRQAQVEPTADDRDILLNVALAWLRLARQTEVLDSEDTGDGMLAGPARSEAFRELAS